MELILGRLHVDEWLDIDSKLLISLTEISAMHFLTIFLNNAYRNETNETDTLVATLFDGHHFHWCKFSSFSPLPSSPPSSKPSILKQGEGLAIAMYRYWRATIAFPSPFPARENLLQACAKICTTEQALAP